MPDPVLTFAFTYAAACVLAAWLIARRWPR